MLLGLVDEVQMKSRVAFVGVVCLAVLGQGLTGVAAVGVVAAPVVIAAADDGVAPVPLGSVDEGRDPADAIECSVGSGVGSGGGVGCGRA
ncbi:MAG: hypothetical protein QM714_14525 [Nocardioides sp.]|uniref:hypothetical protein n=1 Tax=Nocardioides sp. TaxID=35761 RepID=UPI0039E58605